MVFKKKIKTSTWWAWPAITLIEVAIVLYFYLRQYNETSSISVVYIYYSMFNSVFQIIFFVKQVLVQKYA